MGWLAIRLPFGRTTPAWWVTGFLFPLHHDLAPPYPPQPCTHMLHCTPRLAYALMSHFGQTIHYTSNSRHGTYHAAQGAQIVGGMVPLEIMILLLMGMIMRRGFGYFLSLSTIEFPFDSGKDKPKGDSYTISYSQSISPPLATHSQSLLVALAPYR